MQKREKSLEGDVDAVKIGALLRIQGREPLAVNACALGKTADAEGENILPTGRGVVIINVELVEEVVSCLLNESIILGRGEDQDELPFPKVIEVHNRSVIIRADVEQGIKLRHLERNAKPIVGVDINRRGMHE